MGQPGRERATTPFLFAFTRHGREAECKGGERERREVCWSLNEAVLVSVSSCMGDENFTLFFFFFWGGGGKACLHAAKKREFSVY